MADRRSLVRRSVSGVVFVLLTVFCLLLSRYSLMAFTLLISLSLIWEYHSMTLAGGFLRERVLVMLSDALLLVLLPLAMEGIVPMKMLLLSPLAALSVLVSVLYTSTAKVRAGKSEALDHSDAPATAHLLFPLLYVTLPLASFFFLTRDGISYRPAVLMALFIMIWCNDVFAYVFGLLLGQRKSSRKLFPSLSPKKSWAGASGGTVMTFVSSAVCCFTIGVMPLYHWMAVALIVSVLGVYGDLFESMIKRYANVKDAGNIIPGHGGTLDRFDDVLVVAPAVTIYLILFSVI